MSKTRPFVRAIATTAALVALVAGCAGQSTSSDTAAGTDDVTVVLDWTPNTNHTGLYVALNQGYFTDAGLNVSIVQPPQDGAEALVGTGKAQFGVSFQETVTQARTSGVPVVSIAAVIAHNTSGFASPVDRNLTRPQDYAGHTYGGWGSPIEGAILDAVVSADGGDPSQVKNVNIGESDALQSFQRDIDLAWLYEAWDVQKAKLAGEELNFQPVRDYDDNLDWYTPVLITSESLIETDPDLVQRFVDAVSRGYALAIEDPDEAADILLTEVPDLDSDLVHASQTYLADQYQADSPKWGHQRSEVWERFSGWLADNQIIEQGFDWQSAYTDEFVQAVPETTD